VAIHGMVSSTHRLSHTRVSPKYVILIHSAITELLTGC